MKNKNKKNKKIEVVVGDKVNLEFSKVGDYLNDLKPKSNSNKNKIIPKIKK